MYAVIESGGKQHRVSQGETLRLEKLDAAAGEEVVFDRVLLVGGAASAGSTGSKGGTTGGSGEAKAAQRTQGAQGIKVGKPYLQGGKVTAKVLTQGRGEKIRIVKLKRRKHSRKQMGHRQWFTEVKITGIQA